MDFNVIEVVKDVFRVENVNLNVYVIELKFGSVLGFFNIIVMKLEIEVKVVLRR